MSRATGPPLIAIPIVNQVRPTISPDSSTSIRSAAGPLGQARHPDDLAGQGDDEPGPRRDLDVADGEREPLRPPRSLGLSESESWVFAMQTGSCRGRAAGLADLGLGERQERHAVGAIDRRRDPLDLLLDRPVERVEGRQRAWAGRRWPRRPSRPGRPPRSPPWAKTLAVEQGTPRDRQKSWTTWSSSGESAPNWLMATRVGFSKWPAASRWAARLSSPRPTAPGRGS